MAITRNFEFLLIARRLSGFVSRLDFTCRAVGLVSLVCAMLFLAGGCGGGGTEDSAPQGPATPSALTLEVEIDQGNQGESLITVVARLDNPAPSGGTAVMISIVANLEEDERSELDGDITIAEGDTTGTANFSAPSTIVRKTLTIVVNASSTNPSLRAQPYTIDIRGGGNGRPTLPPSPTRPNPVELEFRLEQLASPDASDGRDYRDTEFLTHYGLGAISADEAYGRGYFGQGVTIAVADNGMDITHPDLAVAGKIRAPWHIRNRNAMVREPDSGPGAGHGTYVALLAAGAADNTGGTFEITLDGGNPIPTENVHGVAPQASIMPIAMEGGANPVDAVRHAVENEAQVLNLSIGIPTSYYGKYADRGGVWLTVPLPYFRPLLSLDLGRYTSGLTGEFAEVARILENQDIVLVWATGNERWNSERGSIDMCGKNFIDEDGCQLGEISVTPQELMENFVWLYDRDNLDLTVSFKDMWGTGCGEDSCAEHNSPGGWKEAPLFESGLFGKWLAVAASDENGRITTFSNGCGTARNWCLVAPGQDLTVSPAEPGGISGTSFAAPIVSGALAVLKSRFPDMPMEVIQAILLVSADPVGTRENDLEDPDPVYGWGRLNLGNAVLQQDMVRLPYSVPETVGATRGISPGNYSPALIPASSREGSDGQGRSLRWGQCVSPYEIIRRYRNRN